MPTLEGGLLRKWRQSLDLTQQAVGEACRNPVGRNRIHDIEKGRSSASVDTLLNVIHGIERAGKTRLGTTDQQRLAAFFLGPDGLERDRAFRRLARGIAEAG